MNESGRHCPFLNRTDSRCSRHFSLDQLGHAFDHCFGYYEGCGVYAELLAERRAWRARGHEYDGAGDATYFTGANGPSNGNGANVNRGLTQLTVAGRIPHGAADPAVVSHAPRL